MTEFLPDADAGPVADVVDQPAAELPEEAAPEEAASDDFEQQSLLPPSTTGEPSVDAALAALADLSEQPVMQHVAAFEGVHTALSEALAEVPAPAGD
jgi:hypothetical protein